MAADKRRSSSKPGSSGTESTPTTKEARSVLAELEDSIRRRKALADARERRIRAVNRADEAMDSLRESRSSKPRDPDGK